MDLHEAGLQPDLEGDKRARMVAECRLEMSVRMLRRLLGSELRRLAEPGQRRANGALGLSKTFPDPVGRGLAQAAVEFAKRLPFVAGGNAVDEKRPQAFGGQEQPCDLVGPPDAESSAAAAGSISVAAEVAAGLPEPHAGSRPDHPGADRAGDTAAGRPQAR